MVQIVHTNNVNNKKKSKRVGFPFPLLLPLILRRLLKCICNISFISGIVVGCTLILMMNTSTSDDIIRMEKELHLISSSSSSASTMTTRSKGVLRSSLLSNSNSNSVIQHGDISCEEVFESRRRSRRRKRGTSSNQEDPVVAGGEDAAAVNHNSNSNSNNNNIDWYSIDPNKGQLYAREIITPPVPFVIALHNSEYDSVRWKTIMDTGQYYEQHVHNNFVQVLLLQGKNTNTTTNTKNSYSYVVDVGANIGYYTLLSASLNSNVIAFEPNPSNIVRICESIRLNNNLNNNDNNNDSSNRDIRIFQNAVGESEQHNTDMLLFVPKNPGQGFLKELPPPPPPPPPPPATTTTTSAAKAKGDGNNKNPSSPFLHHDVDETTINDEHHSKTKVISLDKWAEEHHLFELARENKFSIEILKVDVEGHEPQVLLGATKLLQSGIIKHVFTECRRFGRDNVKDMIIALLDAGFVLRQPNCAINNMCMKSTANSRENANSFSDWATFKIGKHKGKTMDLWWEKK